MKGFISDFTHKANSNFCEAYRVKRFEGQAKNLYVAQVKHQRSAFWWLEINWVRESRDTKLNPAMVKIAWSILQSLKPKSFCQYHTLRNEKNCCKHELATVKLIAFTKGRKNRIKNQSVAIQKATTYRKCAIKMNSHHNSAFT